MTDQEKDGLFNAAETYAGDEEELRFLRKFVEWAIKKAEEFRP